ncbi:arsenic ABC transporter ATPase [Mycolicibacterium aromaticivorans JS19b1 = JCM 16368]|uniref:Arsenic ABC transporter ATPase n=1 Tax=Mycolicibacterium aromaticivorans JS19b1 = JCM 16368 TaxID=1440774 RepID=A0A064CDY9_9MYCO|nr:arsenical pump-driving ATPase [Mycolicibacterium aromaticivorans]KDE96943.1 arsenic ABC transporter ATPase [Mycolicibacterium aromaticivorans JS19b1 = JCM 16368]
MTFPEQRFLTDPPRFVFFTGKGGVGKTSIAYASAVALAQAGKKVLLVSTDPASNVGQVFGVAIGNTVTEIPAVPGLSALEIDPEQAATAYRERIVGPVRCLLPESAIASITEQLSGSCTTEIASFDEFTTLLTDDTGLVSGFDHVLFDTAPTGHTIRLLQLPGSWTEFLQAGKGDASCLGPMAGLDKHKTTYAAAVAALADPDRTRLVLVARPTRSALREIDRTHHELAALGMSRQYVVVNAVMPQPQGESDPLAAAITRREQSALADISDALSALPQDRVSLKTANMVGLDALQTLFDTNTAADDEMASSSLAPVVDAPLSDLVDDIERSGNGLVMCMGKGGVGKTTVAAAIAVALAERGHDVHLTTTDPAAHLVETLQGGIEHLRVSRIDPIEASDAYRERVMTTKGAHLDDAGRATLAEDLRSPCTEEVAVFQAFSKVIHESRSTFVVLDTAPTGHTLLLLDATGSYHREIARQMGDSGHYTTPLMRLQNPDLTKVLLVTLAETTPVLEAAGLQHDLERAGIHPWAWVINNSVAAAEPTHGLLRQRAGAELAEIDTVRTKYAPRYAVIPLLANEPVGIPALEALTAQQN